MLYIVSTPIGNLKDITYRAVDILKSVDLIAAEDTRHTGILTKHYDIQTPLTSYFEHNKIKKGEYILEQLKSGKDVALVTDAGTPGISDPGFHLIRLVKEAGIEITAVPGAVALITALTLSGFPAHEFEFAGFLPVKSAGRRKKLELYKDTDRTVIFYESPHRITKMLKDVLDVLGDREVCLARELTKKFEEVRTAKCSEHLECYAKRAVKGEFVVLLKPV